MNETCPTLSPVRLIAMTLVVAVAAIGCSNDGDAADALNDPAAAADAALDEKAQQPVVDEAASAAEPTSTTIYELGPYESDHGLLTTTTLPGIVINQYMLTIDQCFDRVEILASGRSRTVTTLMPCGEPHQFQIFGYLDYPAPSLSLYPGEDFMEDFALQSCYLQFENWVGIPYETSELDIGVLTPERADFENELAAYRGIHCWVRRVDGEPLIGTARGIGV